MIRLGIATLKVREDSFKQIIESVYDQVDEIVAVLNNYTEIPEWILRLDKINGVLSDNRWGDAGKFIGVDNYSGYYFSIDDDLIYPPSYIKDTTEAIDKYKCICTYHGKIFKNRPIRNYRNGYTTAIRCLGSLDRPIVVDIGGSGVMGFHTDHFKLSFSAFKERNMADIWVSKEAHSQNILIMALPHQSTYFKYIEPIGNTIWQLQKGGVVETKIINSFLK